MTVYARSDVAAVSISPDHGGCGKSHTRPAPGGNPVRLWALECEGGCEDYLRSDALWSATPQTVPETPDEVALRTDGERRTQTEQQASLAQALNDLSRLGELPSVLAEWAKSMAGNQLAQGTQPMVMLCRNGHRNTDASKFCAECGASMDDAANRKQAAGALSSAEKDAGTEPVADSPDLESMSFRDLKNLANDVGADSARSKAEQIELIRRKTN